MLVPVRTGECKYSNSQKEGRDGVERMAAHVNADCFVVAFPPSFFFFSFCVSLTHLLGGVTVKFDGSLAMAEVEPVELRMISQKRTVKKKSRELCERLRVCDGLLLKLLVRFFLLEERGAGRTRIRNLGVQCLIK